MVRLMYKKYNKFLMMKHSVLLFINLALVFFLLFLFFYKNSIYTVYRAIHQLLYFHINIIRPKNGTTTVRGKSMQEKNKYKKEKQKKTPKH